jgi:Xaa-Pro aminopeptidase
MEPSTGEDQRAESLRQAQAAAEVLFAKMSARRLVRPGRTEREVSDDIRDLAGDLLGVRRYWHKRIVRSGPNTLHPYEVNPPDRVITPDDIVFCDFGPILEEWEADFGRTFVLGDDPDKHRIASDLPSVWAKAKAYFDKTPGITGADLYAHVLHLAAIAGWQHGGAHAGHLIGEFPHEKIAGDQVECYITADNHLPMRRLERSGRQCHWILEIHLVNRARGYGGFFEQLLDLG